MFFGNERWYASWVIFKALSIHIYIVIIYIRGKLYASLQRAKNIMEAPNGGSPTTRSRGSAKPLIGIRNFLEGPVRSPVVPPFMIAKPGLATFVRPSAVSDVVHLERFLQLCIHRYTFSVYNIIGHDCIFPCALLSVSLDGSRRSTCKIRHKPFRVAVSKPIWTLIWDLVWGASVPRRSQYRDPITFYRSNLTDQNASLERV